MMHAGDDDRAFFEDALQSLHAMPAPLAAVRGRIASDRRRRAALRTVATLCLLAVVAVGAMSHGVVAAVRGFFVPAHDATVLVVQPRGVVFMDAVPTLAAAQKHVPFAIYTPGPTWRLTKIMVSAGPGPQTDVPATTKALYRGADGAWMKITQRPLAAPREVEDRDLSDLLRTPNVVNRTIGNAHLTFQQRILGTTEERVVGASRVVLARVPAAFRSALADPDIEIDPGPPLHIHSDSPPSRGAPHRKGAGALPTVSAFDFHGHARFRVTIDQYGRKGFMFTTGPNHRWPDAAHLKGVHAP